MKSPPILFSPQMVKALLREIRTPGHGKTATRRLAWRLQDEGLNCRPSSWQKVTPGTLLWVRERTLCLRVRPGEIKVRYVADGHEPDDWLPFPSRLKFIPRAGEHLSMGCYLEASRITLAVTRNKIERLQDISEEDALAEGCHKGRATGRAFNSPESVRLGPEWPNARMWFADLWDSLHGIGSWDGNPEVCAISFLPHLVNIEKMEKKA